MSSIPERSSAAERDQRAARTDKATTASHGNSPALSIVLFLVLFVVFLAGLYTLSLFTPVTFLIGLGLCLLALFGTFTVVPKLFT